MKKIAALNQKRFTDDRIGERRNAAKNIDVSKHSFDQVCGRRRAKEIVSIWKSWNMSRLN